MATYRAIDEFTFAGTKYVRGDAFRHALPAIEIGGLLRTRRIEMVKEPVAVASDEDTPLPAQPVKRKQKRPQRPE